MSAQTTNLLGATALALADDMRKAVEAGAAHGANAPAALIVIGWYPAESIDELCRTLDLSHSATVRLVDRLVADGLVERRPGHDGRSVALHLTAAGRRRKAASLKARRAVLDEALGALTTREQASLHGLLAKMLSALTRDRAHADHICRLCDEAVCPHAICPVEAAAT